MFEYYSNRGGRYGTECFEYVRKVMELFGTDASVTAADFLNRANELDTVPDLVRFLRREHGDSLANFTAGYFGGSGEIPDVMLKKR